MSKKLFFGSNLKMYKNIKDTVSYLQELESLTKDISRDEIELFIIPSYTTLDSASKAIDQKNIRLGAQNMSVVMYLAKRISKRTRKFSAHWNMDSKLFYVSARLLKRKNSASVLKYSVHS